jgi:hypothetical protein
VLLSAAGRAGLAGIERVSVRKTEAPCWREEKEAMKRSGGSMNNMDR